MNRALTFVLMMGLVACGDMSEKVSSNSMSGPTGPTNSLGGTMGNELNYVEVHTEDFTTDLLNTKKLVEVGAHSWEIRSNSAPGAQVGDEAESPAPVSGTFDRIACAQGENLLNACASQLFSGQGFVHEVGHGFTENGTTAYYTFEYVPMTAGGPSDFIQYTLFVESSVLEQGRGPTFSAGFVSGILYRNLQPWASVADTIIDSFELNSQRQQPVIAIETDEVAL